METKDLSNQTPEQENISVKEENTEISAHRNPEPENVSNPDVKNETGNEYLTEASSETEVKAMVSSEMEPTGTGKTNDESLITDVQQPVDENLPHVESFESGAELLVENSDTVPSIAHYAEQSEEGPLTIIQPQAESQNAFQQAENESDNMKTLVMESETTNDGTPSEMSVGESQPLTGKVQEIIPVVNEDTDKEIDVEPITGKHNEDTGGQDALVSMPDKTKKTSKKEEIFIDHSEEEKEDSEEDDEEDEENEAIYQSLSRAELVEHLEALVQEPDIQAIKVKMALIKVAYIHKEKEELQAQFDSFLKDGGVPEDYTPEADALSGRFIAATNIYREKRQRFNEELEKEKLANLEAKKKILEDLKVLINSEETLKKTYDEFKALQEQWRHIGMVPKNEINQLWQNYHFLVEKFFDKVKINKELKDLDLKKNLERKIELCEKTEELLIETSILRSFKQLQKYHEEWKEIGPVPQDKKDEIWERFKIASDQINERRREYYNEKQNELESNFLAKSALCEKAEKLISNIPETLRQWQNRTNDVNEMMRVWKTIGPCPKKVNTEVWNRFKTCLDSHFTSYKEYLEKLKDQQLNNYNLKLDLCAQAEAIKNSTDWRKTTQELIHLQQEWKSIGAVPRKHSDKIWKRFRTACDEFFKRKTEFFSNVVQVEEENMKKKEDIIKRLQEFVFTGNRSENLEILKNFQREWLEIGHVPIREKDRLQNTFRTALNKHFDRLKIDASEINALNYKNRLESLKEMPDAGRVIYREKNALQLKAAKLQEDIMLWENNIGFLAESKNANLVKVEFQKKIDQAKQELALMEAKLRYLKEI